MSWYTPIGSGTVIQKGKINSPMGFLKKITG
jgi:hypothetical protein